MISKMLEVLLDPKNEFPEDVQEEIFGIMEHRHDQLFSPDGNLASTAYLAAAYLNPSMSFLVFILEYLIKLL